MIKGVTKTIENKTKEQKGRFLGILLGTLGACLLENMLAGKGLSRASEGVRRAGKGLRQDLWCHLIKDIIKMISYLMVFIHVIICLIKERMGHM